jgi:D-glycero-D-manno-heptose 1,7-bisphosphate phosphatase
MKLVILDRDGVINEDSDAFIRSPDAWLPLPGSLDAIGRLNRASWRVVIATNQSGLRRKLFDIETLNRIHDKMNRQLAEVGARVDAIFICPCLPRENCACRKPAPGMLREIGERLRTPLAAVPYIGDKPTDLATARAAGARPWLVRTGHGMRTEASTALDADVRVFDDLAAAADALLAEQVA